MDKKYEWKYCSLGGAIRVNVASGEDIAHLGELDQKLWTVLSCPVESLEFDRRTLDYIDTDKDGKIKVPEVVAAAQWLTSVIKDKDLILKGESVLDIDQIDTSTETGRRLHDSADRILADLGKEGRSISVEDASDSAAIFAGTRFNGDGLITATSAGDPVLEAVISDCIAVAGSETDRSGAPGVSAAIIENFYAACADYAAWMDAADSDKAVLPFGDKTSAAYVAIEAVKDKVADFFERCRLLRYDKAAVDQVAVSVDDISRIGECPLARPDESDVLRFDRINPAWQARFDAFRSLVLEDGKDSLSEEEWNAALAGFGPYCAWLAAKKGAAAEPLGIARVREILAAGQKAALLELVSKDLALKDESDAIDEVKKLMLLYRDFYRLLKNYVIFTDFYARTPGVRADFEAGQLYIDQRCCDLCIRVSDMSKHADMAKLSGMFLIYCVCSSKKLGKTMDIVAVMTAGDIDALRPGKNGVFYDCAGNDWDAVITKIVDNPVSIRQAFWAPYRKFWDFCVGLINKSAADKDAKITADLQAKASAAASSAPAAPAADGDGSGKKQQAFDIAKFAGIFAALGMAMGYIGSALTKIVTGIQNTPLWQTLVAIVAIMLIISGPSCFLAWSKLRRRNLGPVLNANGWAVNSKVLVNILFGAKLTNLAKYPKLKLSDPYQKKSSAWKWWLGVALLALVAAFVVLLFMGKLEFIGLSNR